MRFTIRDLLLLTVVVALGTGWSTREWHRRADNWELKANALELAVEADGWEVEWGPGLVEVRGPGETNGVTRILPW